MCSVLIRMVIFLGDFERSSGSIYLTQLLIGRRSWVCLYWHVRLCAFVFMYLCVLVFVAFLRVRMRVSVCEC